MPRHAIPPPVIAEAKSIAEVLRPNLTRNLEAREAIAGLKARGSTQWRQSEWIGWHYEWEIEQLLRASIGGQRGPTYGKTEFDYRNKHVWDTKGHPDNTFGGKQNLTLILNDQEAVRVEKRAGRRAEY